MKHLRQFLFLALSSLLFLSAANAQPRPTPGGGGSPRSGGGAPAQRAPHQASTIKLDWTPSTGWFIVTPGVPAPTDATSLEALQLMN